MKAMRTNNETEYRREGAMLLARDALQVTDTTAIYELFMSII
jgi:hypothetical protein